MMFDTWRETDNLDDRNSAYISSDVIEKRIYYDCPKCGKQWKRVVSDNPLDSDSQIIYEKCPECMERKEQL